MIERLRLSGYKSIESFDQPLSPLAVLLGPNDSGKSSLLEALSVLGELSSSYFHDVFEGGKFPAERAWRGMASPRIEWQVAVDGPAEYSLALTPFLSAKIATTETLRFAGSTVFSAREDGQAVAKEVVRTKSEWDRTALCSLRDSLDGVAPVAELLAATRRYELDPAELARPSVFDPNATPKLGRRGYGLPGVLAALKLSDYERFERIESTLRETIPAIRSVIIRSTTVHETHSLLVSPGATMAVAPGHRLAFVLDKAGWEVPAEHASAGVLLFLAYLTLVFSEAPPRHLLIEEPENGIHPHRLKTIVDLLRKLTLGVGGAPPTQVIITTHSPYLLDFVRPEEVLIFRKLQNGATGVTRMADAPDLEARLGEQQLGELWFNIGEEILSGAKKSVP